MTQTVVFRLLILKVFMRLKCLLDFAVTSGKAIDELPTSLGMLTKLGVRDFIFFN